MIDPFRRTKRFATSALTVAVVALCAPVSQAAADGSIAGTVADLEGTGLADVCAIATSSSTTSMASATSGAGGAYTITNLPEDPDYRVRFSACGAGNFASEYFDDKPDFDTADSVSVLDGSTTPNIDARLAAGARITGTVLGPGAAPLDAICVEADDGQAVRELGETNTAGEYEIEDLPAGDYKVHFTPCTSGGALLSEYYDDQPTFAAADTVSVPAGTTRANVDAQLVAGGTISGAVVDSGGVPIADICVTAADAGFDNARGSETNAIGEYTIDGLRPDAYKVKFFSCGVGNFASEYFDDQPSRAAAQDVIVAGGAATTAIDAQLAGGSTITGTVTAPGGVPLDNVCVRSSDDELDGEVAITDANGEYVLAGLHAGAYKIGFTTCEQSDLLSEYYDDQPIRATADPVIIGEAETSADIDAELDAAGSIAGTVTDPGGNPLSDICVEGDDAGFDNGDSAITDGNGQYLLEGLRAGSYKLHFYSCGAGNFAREYYNDKPKRASADPVVVRGGLTTAGRNARLAVGGRVSGTVTGTGTIGPLPDICVTASDANFVSSAARTDASGQYTIDDLHSGSYKVEFASCGGGNFVGEFYDDELSKSAADPVAVATGLTRSNVDAELEGGGTIKGTVRGPAPAGALLAGICVSAADGEFEESTQTGANGQYTLEGLRPGSYKLEFASCGSGNLAREFWNNKPTRAAADAIVVSAGATILGRDAQLDAGATITGTVTGPGELPLEGVCVGAYDADLEAAEPVVSGGDGTYAIEDLQAGSYKVLFSSCEADALTFEWYTDRSSAAAADLVAVTSGVTRPGIDAELETGGAISGVVTDAQGVVAGACVKAYDPAAEQLVYASTETGVDGTYTLDGLPSGSFKVYFEGGCAEGDLEDEYYDDAEGYADAALVSVSAPSETVSVDAELAALVVVPTVTIASGPSGQTSDKRPLFEFIPSSGATIECSISGSAPVYGPCSAALSHQPDEDLIAGNHTFSVRATNSAGSATDTRSFTVVSPPTVTIDSGPTGETTDRRPTFDFTSSAGATAECSISPAAPIYGPCSGAGSHRPDADLGDGSYTFSVQVTNTAGTETAMRSFLVTSESIPPTVEPPSEPPADPPPVEPGDTIACAIAQQKLTQAIAAVKKAKKLGKKAKLKKAKAKLKKARAAVASSC